MHRSELRAGLVVKVTELGLHVTTHNNYASTTIYAHMVCGKRYLISRLQAVEYPNPRMTIACGKCLDALVALEVTTPPSPLPHVAPSRGKGSQVRAIYKCGNQRCRMYAIEFASAHAYEAKCPQCRRAAIWQRGYA